MHSVTFRSRARMHILCFPLPTCTHNIHVCEEKDTEKNVNRDTEKETKMAKVVRNSEAKIRLKLLRGS